TAACPLVLVVAARAASDPHTHSLHDALPIFRAALKLQNLDKLKPEYLISKLQEAAEILGKDFSTRQYKDLRMKKPDFPPVATIRSEEHTSELQSRENLVCRLLLEQIKNRDGY